VQGRTGYPRTADPREAADAAQCIPSRGANGGRFRPDSSSVRPTGAGFAAGGSTALTMALNRHRGVARKGAGRKPEPTAGVIDSRSVKTAESGGLSGCGGGRKIKGASAVPWRTLTVRRPS